MARFLIKAVTFDMWNTLIKDKDYVEQRVKYLADGLREQRIHRSHDEIRAAIEASLNYASTVWREENYRHVPAEEMLNHILERLSTKLPQKTKVGVLKRLQELAASDPPPLIEGVKETLEFLSPKYKMGVICNTGITPGKVLRKVLAQHGILRFFSVSVFSDETGHSKPHRAIFESALKGLGVEPAEALHVGDLIHTDVAGARAVGMKTVWFNPKMQHDVGSSKPDYQIQTFSELITILDKI